MIRNFYILSFLLFFSCQNPIKKCNLKIDLKEVGYWDDSVLFFDSTSSSLYVLNKCVLKYKISIPYNHEIVSANQDSIVTIYQDSIYISKRTGLKVQKVVIQ